MHPKRPHASRLATALALAAFARLAPAAAAGGDASGASPRALDRIVVRGLQPTSLPTRLPTTVEGITGVQVTRTVNATDAEDALKYLPSLLVRKRYIGDYDHAVLATRASGTNNSARSLVYADGILLSNLLGNGATFAPRWGMVNPEEIERVDVLYGPFSAAYPGNSVGAVVDYVTRMPDRFEAHARLGYSVERFHVYATDATFPATSLGASFGDRWGALSAWLSLNRVDAHGHPIAFASATPASPNAAPTPVSGAVADLNTKNQPYFLVGAYGQTDTVQDEAKLKLAYDLAPGLRLSYVFGTWTNDADRDAETYLQDASGVPVYAGPVVIDGRPYALASTAIAPTRNDQLHRMHGLTLRRDGDGAGFSVSASRYMYARDLVRSPTVALPAAATGGAGRIADAAGTGWTTLAGALTWSPATAHAVEVGLQDDTFKLATTVYATSDWLQGMRGARVSAFGGSTELRSAYAQDTWTVSPRWTTTLGLRHERWAARNGYTAAGAVETPYASRRASDWSPKAAVQFRMSDDASIKASIGRAVRYPTVSELFQGTTATNAIVINEPDLAPERSWTSELSYVRSVEWGHVRTTYFHERTRDALYSQTNVTVVPNVTGIQNVGLIRTNGMEVATSLSDVAVAGLDVDASATFADSIIEENTNFPASEGKWQPRVPRWRANLIATYHPGEHWSFTGAARYSGRQFNTLDNSDVNSHTYFGTSPFLVLDARVHYRADAHWSGAVGVDNLGDRTYWNFHPYNQRTFNVEVRYDD
ncbi:TonB-dependent receptor [Cognatilysobacter terrigena]|uniref:TonB-dependent receptor n=1 Tax=Cognatilysobacter terrigena TaxID=2488749 RepID=UPI00105E60AE|nr:TonB-dependent receptor [Lysobacter terrigena]